MESRATHAWCQLGHLRPIKLAVRPVVAAVCTLIGLGTTCATHQHPADRVAELRVGFGFGGTALAGALPNLIDTLTAEPLVAIGWDGRPVPKLAVSWEWADSGRTLKLRLRQGVVFHDGTPLTPASVIGDLNRHLSNPAYARVESITADGSDSVVFRLTEPDAFLLAELFKATIKTGKDRRYSTGPYMIRDGTPDVIFEAFRQYHLGQPVLSRVTVRTYATPRAAWAAMMRGEVDFLYEVNRDSVDFLEAGSHIETFSFPRPYYIPIVFNIKHPILGRRAVRQAINEGIDRSAVVKTALNDRGHPADGPIWPYHWAYHSASRTYTYNPEAARLRLDAARLPVVSAGDGMPSRLAFKCLFWSEDPQFERIALVVQKQLFEIGVDVEMVPMTLSDIQQRLGSGQFEAVLLPMVSGRSLEWTYLFWRSASKAIVNSGYTAADAALDRLRAAQSDDDTRIAVADLQRILYEDPPAAFLVRPETARAVDRSFVVPGEAKGRDIAGTLWQWKPRIEADARSGK